jgi:hypothetical protein
MEFRHFVFSFLVHCHICYSMLRRSNFFFFFCKDKNEANKQFVSRVLSFTLSVMVLIIRVKETSNDENSIVNSCF